MPKPPRKSRPKHLHIVIDASLVEQLDLFLLDPLTGKPLYGARTQVFEILLSLFLSAYKKGETTLDLKPLLAQFRKWVA